MDIWKKSLLLSQPFWDHYERLIGPTNLRATTHENQETNIGDQTDFHSYNDNSVDYDSLEEEEEINAEYLEFIKQTKKHQAERDRLRKLEAAKRPDLNLESYFKDISEVNTLVEDNLVQAPSKSKYDSSQPRQDEKKLIKLYDGREAYEKIRSMEMIIDDNFKRKCQEQSPNFWPVMPLNPKPYLNPIIY